VVQGLSLAKLNDGRPEHLLHVGSVVVGSHWKNLLNGSLIAYIRLDSPRLIVNLKRIFSPAGDRDNGNPRLTHDTKTDEPLSWQKKVEQLPPFRISSVVLTNGEVQVQGMSSQGGADLRIDHLNFYLDNVTNSTKLAPSLMTKALCKGRVMSTGSLGLRAEGYPLAEAPIFNIDFQIVNLDLTEVVKLGRNKPKDRIATRLDFEGSLDAPELNIADAILAFFRNSFLTAERALLEHRAST